MSDEFDSYGAKRGLYFEDIMEILSPPTMYYAEKVGLSDLAPEIAGIKYSELFYNPDTENCWACVRQHEGMAIWIIPK